MQLEQIRTFLQVVSTRSFSAAATHLNVTQSTVSARIKALEEALGRQLFRRGVAGAELTEAGQRFQRHATTMLRGWSEARQEVALPAGYRRLFRLGGPVGYWDRLIVRWVPWMQRRLKDVALRLEGNYSASLSDQLADGRLDLGIMYMPQQRPGLIIETLLDEELLLVTGGRRVADWQRHFVMIDWGEEQRSLLLDAFPDMPPPAISVGLVNLGLIFMLQRGASGYMPASAIDHLLEAGSLRLVPGAPRFRQSVFVVYPRRPQEPEVLEVALQGLRAIMGSAASAASETAEAAPRTSRRNSSRQRQPATSL